uniref:Ran guanine nucleotide release factor n=1 Tax=Ananas comosus var. bracteatus TaxID=296719 RepID=A0A6V7P6E2_ANACO|nr:unnamed protein product [Ananas comosus var. bracteatus]
MVSSGYCQGTRCGGTMVLEHSGTLELPGLSCGGAPTIVTTAVGQLAISKGRQGREAHNVVQVYLANLRLKEVSTDVLITAYEPIFINPLSESARTVGAGPTVLLNNPDSCRWPRCSSVLLQVSRSMIGISSAQVLDKFVYSYPDLH